MVFALGVLGGQRANTRSTRRAFGPVCVKLSLVQRCQRVPRLKASGMSNQERNYLYACARANFGGR